MLPSILQCRLAQEDTNIEKELLDGSGTPTSCGDFVNAWGHHETGAPTSPVFSDDDWADCGGGTSASHQVLIADTCGADGKFVVTEKTTRSQVRFALSDEDAKLAIPESWRDMFETNQKILVKRTTTSSKTTHRVTTSHDEATKCFVAGDPEYAPAFPTQPPPSSEWLVFDDVTSDPEVVCQFESGTQDLNPPAAEATDLYRTRNNAGQQCTGGGALTSVTFTILGSIIPTVSFPLTP
jgi:hypothetical protein